MSESKSDALTSLATPLHRCPARAVHLEPSRLVRESKPRDRPSRRADGAPASGTSGPTSPRANRSASLPMAPCRFLPARRPRFPNPSSGCCRRFAEARPPRVRPRGKAPRPRPGGRSSRSLRRVEARFPVALPRARLGIDTGTASGKPAILAAATRSATSGPAEDLARGQCRRRLDDGEPRRRDVGRHQPLADAARRRRCAPARKNGTSAPSARPIGRSRSSGQSRRQRRLSASSVEAASELPPPRPAPQGTRLSIEMSAPSGVPEAACSARAARRHRSSAGSAAPRSWRARQAVAARARSAACRTSRSAPSATRAGGSRRRAGRRRAGTGSAWPAPARRRGRRCSSTSRAVELDPHRHDRRRRLRASPTIVPRRSARGRRASRAGEAAPLAARRARRRRATAGRAASRTRPRSARSRRAPRGSARRGRRSGASRAASPARPRRATSAPAPSMLPSGVDRPRLPARESPRRSNAADDASGAARSRPARREARGGPRGRRRSGAAAAGGTVVQAASERRSRRRRRVSRQRLEPRPRHRAAPGHRSTRRRASVSRRTSFCASRDRASRKTRAASSVWPALHSTSPRCAAISGSGRD